MPLTALYDGRNVEPAYQLRYGWTGWPSPGQQFPAQLPHLLPQLAVAWEADGLRLLEHCCTPAQVQLTFSTKPDLPPVFVAARAKGRVQYMLRQSGQQVPFSRNLALRAIGNVRRGQVERYVRSQVASAPWAGTEFARRMEEFTVVNPRVDLSRPTETSADATGIICIWSWSAKNGIRRATCGDWQRFATRLCGSQSKRAIA